MDSVFVIFWFFWVFTDMPQEFLTHARDAHVLYDTALLPVRSWWNEDPAAENTLPADDLAQEMEGLQWGMNPENSSFTEEDELDENSIITTEELLVSDDLPLFG